MHRLSRFLICVAVACTALASSGDRAPEFVNCVAQCTGECGQNRPLSIPLQLACWTCEDDCKYTCMHEITDRSLERSIRVQQYYGKWPFWRFGGMQEPASVAFSLMNLWAHARGALKTRKLLPTHHPMKSYYLVWSLASINAWTWSSIFHTRDLPFTEKMDYFSAALAIMYALFYTVIRLCHIYPLSPQSRLPLSSKPSNNLKRTALSCICTLAYISHISYLTLLPRFDYTYNMAFNLGVGLVHNALWLVYSLPVSLIRRFPSQPKTYRPAYVNKAAAFVVVTTAATALELFDFPPWQRIIDAHALWHLATVPIAFLWYDFLIQDGLDPSWRAQRA